MKLLLKNCNLINHNENKICDIYIENTKIKTISENLDINDVEIIDLNKAWVMPGFVDMHVHLREPGQEEKETLRTGLTAAVHGGFTAVCSMPNTNPVIDNKFLLQFLTNKAWEIDQAKLWVIGAITKGLEGKELAEMGMMARNGAVAFTDDGHPLENLKLLRRALEYIRPFEKPLILHCENKDLTENGSMNESGLSTRIGLPGIHAASEEAAIAASLETSKYFGKIHIAHVSTAGSVEIIRSAKKRGIQITAETAPHYFYLTEDILENYDVNAKMNPPLRSEKDRLAIIEGLKDGTIDVIASDHAPHTPDDKNKEFNLASFGIIGLETSIMLAINMLYHQHSFKPEKLVQLYSYNPSKIIDIPGGELKQGAVADLTIINPTKNWEINIAKMVSKSKNSPFNEFTGKGKAIMTIINGEIKWKEDKID